MGARFQRPEELPIQPLFREADGSYRFVANEFVRWMIEQGRQAGLFDLNALAQLGYPDDHFAQLLQLMGYSLAGFETHSAVPNDVWARVEACLQKFEGPEAGKEEA